MMPPKIKAHGNSDGCLGEKKDGIKDAKQKGEAVKKHQTDAYHPVEGHRNDPRDGTPPPVRTG